MTEFDRRMQEATERAEKDFAEGVVREPVTAFRVNIEMSMLAKQNDLSNREANMILVEHLKSKGMTVDDFKRISNKRENLDLVREAFAGAAEVRTAKKEALHNRIKGMFLQGFAISELPKYFGLTESEIRDILQPDTK